MKSIRTIILIVSIVNWTIALGQSSDSITIEYCYSQTMLNYPILKQKQILKDVTALKVRNINAQLLPRMDINGQATYQSDVVHVTPSQPQVTFKGFSLPPNAGMNIYIPPSEAPDKDQYKVSLDVNQIIYDAGITKKQRELEVSSLAADTMKVDVDIYQLKERVNQIYFVILLMQEKDKQLLLLIKELQDKQKILESGVKNGTVILYNLNTLKAEQLKAEQQITENKYSRIAAIKMLSKLINSELPDNSGFKAPNISISETTELLRPEYKFFSLQQSKLESTIQLYNKRLLPRVFAFGQMAYGKPGLNMFKNEFNDYYIVGAKLTWNFWDWNQNKRDLQIISLQKNMIDVQKEVLDKNISILAQNELANIQKYDELIITDEKIIALRESMAITASAQFENGTITATDYASELNSKSQARFNMEAHKILQLQAKVNYMTIVGK